MEIEVTKMQFIFSDVQRRHICLEIVEGKRDKRGTESLTDDIKPRTSKSQNDSSTNCTKPSFSNIVYFDPLGIGGLDFGGRG